MVQHVVKHRIETCPFVQILDALVPQMGDQVLVLLQKIISSLVEPVQVLAVPKISLDRVSQRSALPVPQTAEQLVEVLTEPVYDAMVVASKVYSRRDIRRILSGQGSTASGWVVEGVVHVEVFKVLVLDRIQQRIWSRSLKFLFLRVGGGSGGGLEGCLPVQNSAAVAEQIVDFQARGGPQGFLPARVLPHRVVCLRTLMMEFMWFFALFSGGKKSAEVLRQSSARVPASPSSSELDSHQMAPARESD